MDSAELLNKIGLSCRLWRMKMGYSMKTVSEETGNFSSNIYRFETGRNNSATIFAWYLARGFNVEKDMVQITDIPYKKVSLEELLDAKPKRND